MKKLPESEVRAATVRKRPPSLAGRLLTRAALIGVFCLSLVTGHSSLLLAASPPEVKIGSKVFTEGVILGEMAVILARSAGARTVDRRELGGTQVLWNALLKGEIDLYPEYTGTIAQEILQDAGAPNEEAIRQALAKARNTHEPPPRIR